MTTGVDDDHRAVATAAAQAFGGERRISRYADESEKHYVDLVACDSAPFNGLTSYSTVGLFRVQNMLEAADVRVELAAACRSEVEEFANVIATCAFFVSRNHWLAAPGVTFRDVMVDYRLGTSMSHIVWVGPFSWPTLSSVAISPRLKVHWLQGIPIYESERRFIEARGFNEFEVLLEQAADLFDLRREPFSAADH